MRFVLAFRAFFAVLFNRDRAIEVQHLLALPPAPPSDAKKLTGPGGSQPKAPSARADSNSAAGVPDSGAPASGVPDSGPLASGGTPASGSVPSSPKPGRSDAITLLATLQREARFVDLVQESLDQYTDAQIGAAARDVLRDTKKCLNQMLAIEPLSQEGEGVRVQLPAHPSPVQWKLVGEAKQSGTIVHSGWKATKISMPIWTGAADDQSIIAPVEVE